jgi:hypothetical protein
VSELTERLDAIQTRVDEAEAKRKRSRAFRDPIFDAGMMLAIQASSADVPFLLDLARKQQAALDAVREACDRIITNADGHKPPGPPHPTREQATAVRIRQALEAKP